MKRFLLIGLSLFQFFFSQAQSGNNSVVAALQLIEKNREDAGLPADYLSRALISSTYTVSSTGLTMVYLQQLHQGIPVFNKMQVLAFMGGKLVSHAGQFIQDIEKGTLFQDLPEDYCCSLCEAPKNSFIPLAETTV